MEKIVGRMQITFFEKKPGDCIIFNNRRNISGHSVSVRYQNVPAATNGFMFSMENISALYFIYEPSSIFIFNGKYACRWTNLYY